MKIQNFLILLVVTLVTFTSCKKGGLIRNGAVQIEFLKVPAEEQKVTLDSNVEFIIDFQSRVQIEDVEVILFVEDASKFRLNNDDKLILKNGVNLTNEPSDDMIIFKHENSVYESSYEFEETVDLSNYTLGTNFVLRASAMNNTIEGTQFKTTYFQKEN